MVFQPIISRFAGRSRISVHLRRLFSSNCNPSVKFSDQLPKPLSQITQKRGLFSGTSENNQGPTRVLHNALPKFLGNKANSLLSSLKLTSSIHSIGQKEFEKNSGLFDDSNRTLDDINTRQQPPIDTGRNVGYFNDITRRLTDPDNTRAPTETGRDSRPFWSNFDLDNTRAPTETGRDSRPFWSNFGSSSDSSRNMNFVRGIMKDNNENYRSGLEQNADIVHIKIMRNNTFVTVTDSKGNKKMGASAGSLAEMKGGPKVSKYSAEATAEHVGRVAKGMGLKSVVMKVNGFTFFKKKKSAILGFRDGYTHSRSDRNPIVYIEDTTRKPHNGCRLRKQRRV